MPSCVHGASMRRACLDGWQVKQAQGRNIALANGLQTQRAAATQRAELVQQQAGDQRARVQIRGRACARAAAPWKCAPGEHLQRLRDLAVRGGQNQAQRSERRSAVCHPSWCCSASSCALPTSGVRGQSSKACKCAVQQWWTEAVRLILSECPWPFRALQVSHPDLAGLVVVILT